MVQVKKLLMAGATFSVALGIGFVMQNGDVLAARFGTEPAVVTDVASPLAEPMTAASPITDSPDKLADAEPAMPAPMPEPLKSAIAIPAPMPKPAVPAAPVRLAAVEADAPLTDAPPAGQPIPPLQCEPDMTARNGPAAMVTLSISAPCATDTPFVIHHQGMMISALTDATGKTSITVPALAEAAVFIAAFPDGSGAVATSVVPDVVGYERAVLQWQGDTGLNIQAYENGAAYGESGNVSATSPRDAAIAVSGEGGFLVRLGETGAVNPQIAEVYTYPVGVMAKDSAVDLSVEAEITSANCGRDIAAQSIQIVPGSDPQAVDLTMTMPACDGVGDFLVLNNMFDGIRVAAR